MSDNLVPGSGLPSWARQLAFTVRGLVARLPKVLSLFSASSMSSETKRIASEGWSFSVRIDGDDLVCDNCTATWFGGCDDPLDNGQTASGVPTCGNPELLGCALPVVANHPSTAGSPLAYPKPNRIPWHTRVEVSYKGRMLTVPLIDNGPAKSANDAIDLTQAAFRYFAPIKQGVLKGVSFRVLGAAKYATGRCVV